jgi:hypothetical protein
MENSEIINAFLTLRYLADISCGEIKEIKLDEKARDYLDKILKEHFAGYGFPDDEPIGLQATLLGIKITKE